MNPVSFIAEYASWMQGCGATCIRIQKNVKRIADHFGITAGITIMPTYVEVINGNPVINNNYPEIAIRKIQPCGINFTINANLSRLSWEIADKKFTLDEAYAEFNKIVSSPPTNKWRVLIQASLANAAFCRLFQGDAVAMAIVFVTTLIGFRLRQVMLAKHCDFRITVICASFVSATLAACCYRFGFGGTPEIALGTSVLYLIPGVPYIDAVSDIIDKQYLCALYRVMDAGIITICLTIGLCLGIMLLGLKIL